MNAIISTTRETIANKKRQINELQERVNNAAFDQADALKRMYELKINVEQLESDLVAIQKKQDEGLMMKPSIVTDRGCNAYIPSMPSVSDVEGRKMH